jgi:hypothetical protein
MKRYSLDETPPSDLAIKTFNKNILTPGKTYNMINEIKVHRELTVSKM